MSKIARKSMAIKHKSISPVILSQFISPCTKAKLVREIVSVAALMKLRGILYMKYQFEKFKPNSKQYKSKFMM